MEEERKEEKSLKQLIEDLTKKVDEKDNKPKKKAFWIPMGARVGKNKAKKGWATIMVIKENRNIDFVKQPIDEQTVSVDGIPRIAKPDETLYYKGKPFIILPSWSTKPYSPTDKLEGEAATAYSTQGLKLIANRLEKGTLENKKKISGWMIFIIIALVIGAGYLAYTQGLFK